MSDRSSSTDDPRWGPASTHRTSGTRPHVRRSDRSAGSSPSRPTAPSRPAGTWPPARTQNRPPSAGRAQGEGVWSSPRTAGRTSPATSSGAPAGPPVRPAPSTRAPLPGRPRRRLGRFARRRLFVLLVVLVLIALYPITLVRAATGSMGRLAALPTSHLGSAAAGRNFLVVGSDSRAGTRMDKVQGQRADTIMLLHVPTHGQSILMSLPRDSYVTIPDHGKHKINAAFAIGGPKLLARTVEQLTGITIDDYVQTNLGGFSKLVDAVGGVRLCPKFDMNDPDAHINLKKGCQQMNGATALGYARARHSDPQGDLGRVKRQRELLASIVGKAQNPATLLNPFAAYPLARAGGQALTVDRSTSTWALFRFLMGMRSVSGSGGGFSITAPVGNAALATSDGSAVQLDPQKAPAVFRAIKDGDTDQVKRLAG